MTPSCRRSNSADDDLVGRCDAVVPTRSGRPLDVGDDGHLTGGPVHREVHLLADAAGAAGAVDPEDDRLDRFVRSRFAEVLFDGVDVRVGVPPRRVMTATLGSSSPPLGTPFR